MTMPPPFSVTTQPSLGTESLAASSGAESEEAEADFEI